MSDSASASSSVPENRRDMIAAVREAVDALLPQLRFHYHHLHRHPELSWEEHQTAEYVEDWLRDLGIETRRMAGTGVVADLPGSEDLPIRVLRCDLDAIAVTEESGLPYASVREGVMHACGHDAHAAILLGVAKALSELDSLRRRPVRLIFQPAEEVLPSGSQRMIDEGVIDGVGDVITLHVWPPLQSGQVGFRDGVITAAADGFECVLRGPGGHGARPYETVDLIALGARVVSGVLDIPRMHLHPERQPAVVSFGSIHAGENFNVIPTKLKMRGTIRTLEAEARRLIHEGMHEVVEDLTRVVGGEHELTIDRGPPAVENDHGLSALARQLTGELWGEDAVAELDLPSMGSEDFGHYLEHVPGLLLRLGCVAPDKERVALHSNRFHVDEDALPIGVGVMTVMGLA